VEPGESPAQAALREAREEAGVLGEIDDRPLTRYRYQAQTGFGLPAEVCVEAYLARVEAQASPGSTELMRGPSWFGPEDAVARLVQNRDTQWAREHRRLVNAAMKRLRT
jgi:8-oxo-dGTP pyrophosphatase MutT (NUDIX family)